MRRRAIIWASCATVVWGAAVQAQPNAASSMRDVAAWIERLDDDDFAARDEARRRLEGLAADPATAEAVRSAVAERLASSIDFELKTALESIARKFPPAGERTAPPPPDEATLAAWLTDLESDQFARRERAQAELQAAAARRESAGPLMLQIERRLAAGELSYDGLNRISSVRETAWGTWLRSDPKAWRPPPVDDAQIAAAVDRLAADDDAASSADASSRHSLAERELSFYLSRDDVLPRAKAQLERRLAAGGLSAAASDRLTRVLDWTRPAMVAEFWAEGRHGAMQHLLIGVPNQPQNAPRPSLFDRCDDVSAHCVSGNSLSPGDWPVGVFFPHPSELQEGAQFHLVNLPTPRRRLAYQYEVPLSASPEQSLKIDRERRAQITRRTVDYLLAQKRLLTLREIDMLLYLDAEQVSRLVEPYLTMIDDVRVPKESPTAFGNGSSHGLFCYVIATVGTATAGPGLIAAIEKRRVLEPIDETPFRMDWIALLSLGRRAPWPGLDAWLAKQIDRTEAINLRVPDGADVGASAAALLVERRGGSPAEFGLERQEFVELTDLENPGYRFRKGEGRAAVRDWFRTRGATGGAAVTP